ncbi:hypothetical protein ACLB1R_20515 [Escherichia coli]
MNLTLIKGHIVLVERPEEPLMSLKDLAMDAFATTLNAAGSSLLKAPSKPPLTHRRSAVPSNTTVDIALCKVTINRILNVHDWGIF